ncbi:MAG: hypothetical protein C0616_05590 [Desulfuromonas sp.]|nr:MAG: hypothetical protein C0616_05590 [Desulfuromonas sp.]
MKQDVTKRLADRVDQMIDSYQALKRERDMLLVEKQRWQDERVKLQGDLDAILEKFARLES